MQQKIKRIRELTRYAVTLARDEGVGTMAKRGAGFVRRRCFGKKARYLPEKKVLEAQRAEFAEIADTAAGACPLPRISVLTALYNTPENYLRAFLDSFVGQTAPNGQLCLADASDAAHAYVGDVVREYQAKNQQIVYQKVENRGIAANTNAAAALASGEYLALADHDDILAPHALYTMGKAILYLRANGAPDGFLYSDEALFRRRIERPLVAHFKPDYAPDYLLACNYICHLAVFKKSLYEQVGGEDPACDGSQDHDLFLRLVERTGGAAHVPQVLYYWRVHEGSTSGGTAAKPYVEAAAKKALTGHLARTGRKATVESGLFPSTYRVKWEIEPLANGPVNENTPKVSILIPNKDHTDDLEKCLYSLYSRTNWENYEVIVIENNSTQPETFEYYRKAQQRFDGLRVVEYKGKGFNFSAINNLGRRYAAGQYLLLLNNDIEVPRGEGDWLTEMLRQCAHAGGADLCGAMLYYPDDTIQHAGVITGLGGYAGHSHKYKQRGGSGYMFRAATVQDLSAVTAACLLVRASVYDALGGLDEKFTVAFNDVDFCLRARDAGYRVVWTPYAALYHHESKSRGDDERDPTKRARFEREHARLYEKHGRENLLHDPYYNPNLTLDREDFSESDDLRDLKQATLRVNWRT
jgi:GT2 family glycosyltransferase